MNEVDLVVRLAKVIRTPKQALVVLSVCILGVTIAYIIPADALAHT